MEMISDVHKTFLSTTKLAIWQECLAKYHSFLKNSEHTTKEVIDEFPRGLYVAIYTRWLSWLWGDREGVKHASTIFDELAELIENKHHRINHKSLQLAKAIIASGRSYVRRAQELIEEECLSLGPEVACLMVPHSPTQKAILLKPFVKKGTLPFFLPAFYFYCDALLQLGNFQEINLQLKEVEEHASTGFIIDLKGRIFEREGKWDEAFKVYKLSDWATHQFRALICENIMNSRGAENRILNRLTVDKKIYEGMNNFTGEIDQLELARSQAFIHACRWYSFDTWLVNFELGKLNFRRKRYLDAELHLKKAVENAPEHFRFQIHILRHINLTWVNENKHGFYMTPEALETAIDAIHSKADEELKTHVIAWVFMVTQDEEFLQPILDSSSFDDIGNAYSRLGDTAKALFNWRQGAKMSYYHRNVSNLVRFFNSVQFYNTTNYLAGVIMQEDQENFFGIWEFGKDWLAIVQKETNFSDERSRKNRVLGDILSKLEILCQDNFQDLIRAAELFINMKRVDIAEALMVRAEKLAESPGELIEIAIIRRSSPAFNPILGDNHGLDCLLKAEKESQSRIEKLQIARELGLFYKQAPRARRILEEQLTLKELNSFQPIEFVVALQCLRLLEKEELDKLIELATNSLRQDSREGVIKKFGTKFLDRISDVYRYLPSSIYDPLKEELTIIPKKTIPKAPKEDTEGKLPSLLEMDAKELNELIINNWRAFVEEIALIHLITLKEEQYIWEKISGQLKSMNLDSKYALWSWLQKEVNKTERQLVNFRPEFDQDKTPISKSGIVVGDVRAVNLSQLWKSYFYERNTNYQSNQLERIRTFAQEEKQLLNVWEKRRVAGMIKPKQRLVLLIDQALKVLESIRFEETQKKHWPFFLNVEEYLLKDIQHQVDRLEKLRSKFQNEWEPDLK